MSFGKQVVSTPLPFVTLPAEIMTNPATVTGIMKTWPIIMIVIHVIFFLVFLALLIVNLVLVHPGNKDEAGYDTIDSDDKDSDSDDD